MKVTMRLTLLASILVFGFLYFTSITHLSKLGQTIFRLREEVEELEKKNHSLTFLLGEEFTLSKLEEEAKLQGLILHNTFTYIPTPASSLVVSKR